MKVSLLLATLNREELAQKAVRSILNQTYQNFEIIVIDQSDVASSVLKEMDKRIVYIHIRKRGLSHARNIGLRYVTGDIVGLMDDDAEYVSNVLEKVVSYFFSNSDVGLVSGKTVDPNTGCISLRGMKNDFTEIKEHNILNYCISPAMFFLADDIRCVKFDEKLGVGCKWGSSEETDAALQVMYKGKKILFCPDVIVKHPGVEKRNMSFSKLESYSLGFGALFAKHKIQYGNKKLYYVYFKVLLKQLAGVVLSCMKFDKHMIHYYYISFINKRKGFKQYMEENKKATKDTNK